MIVSVETNFMGHMKLIVVTVKNLQTVLNSSDLRVIAQTLRDLPVGLVIPLLKELETRLRTRNIME